MPTITPNLTGARETALLALYARALDCRAQHPILNDADAAAAVDRLDYDWKRFKSAENQRFNVAIRTRQMDEWTSEFVEHHPDAVLLDLGCGLDRRADRVAPPSTAVWYDIDFPEVIALRAALYGDQPAWYRTIGTDLTSPEWLDSIPDDRPCAVVADGVLPFLPDPDVKRLITRIVEHFPSGQLVFNQYTGLMARLARMHPAVKATGAALNNGINDPHELELWHRRLRLVDEAPLVTSPHIAPMPAAFRVTCKAMAAVPALRRYGQIVRYRF